MGKYIMALDQGTTSSRCIIYDKKGFFSLKASDEVGIKWSQIKKIGTDVILVTKNT